MKIKYIFLFACLIFFINIASGQTTISDGDLCAIESNPEAFLDKPLDVKAVYFAGLEMGWLDGVNPCQPRKTRIVYKFAENYESNTDAKVLKRVKKLLIKTKTPYPRKIRGAFRIQVTKHIKKNENENLYDYDITVLKIISVEQVKK
jgi:hypothetical protein